MSCNRYKNRNYKSALQYFNTTAQAIAVTDVITNPLLVDLGLATTNTGVAFDFNGNEFDVDFSGLYQFMNEVSITGTTAGDVFVGLTIDGVLVPETLRQQTLVVGATVTVPLTLIKQLSTCCANTNKSIRLIVYSDGTATGTISRVSGNALKLA